MTGLISFAMKTAKVVLTYRDYPPISVLSNSVTILEKHMYKSLCIKVFILFSITKTLSITHSAVLENNILYLINN